MLGGKSERNLRVLLNKEADKFISHLPHKLFSINPQTNQIDFLLYISKPLADSVHLHPMTLSTWSENL